MKIQINLKGKSPLNARTAHRCFRKSQKVPAFFQVVHREIKSKGRESR